MMSIKALKSTFEHSHEGSSDLEFVEVKESGMVNNLMTIQ